MSERLPTNSENSPIPSHEKGMEGQQFMSLQFTIVTRGTKNPELQNRVPGRKVMILRDAPPDFDENQPVDVEVFKDTNPNDIASGKLYVRIIETFPELRSIEEFGTAVATAFESGDLKRTIALLQRMKMLARA